MTHDPMVDVERMKRGLRIMRQHLVEKRQALDVEGARIDVALAEVARVENLDGADPSGGPVR